MESIDPKIEYLKKILDNLDGETEPFYLLFVTTGTGEGQGVLQIANGITKNNLYYAFCTAITAATNQMDGMGQDSVKQ